MTPWDEGKRFIVGKRNEGHPVECILPSVLFLSHLFLPSLSSVVDLEH